MIFRPDLDDALYFAAEIHGRVAIDEARFHVNVLSAERALQQTRGVRGRHGQYSDLGAVGAALFIAFVNARFDPDPEDNVHIAWLLVRRLVQLNDREWIRLEGDQDALTRLLRDESVLDFHRVARWVDKHIGRDLAQASLSVVDLRIHITSRIYQLAPKDRNLIETWSKAIREEMKAFSARHTELDVHLTALCPSEDVWPVVEGNEVRGVEDRLLLADGQISLGLRGGSEGAGLDDSFSADGMIPILHLQPEEEPFSPRLKSWLLQHGARICPFPIECTEQETIAVIKGRVAAWLNDTLPEIARSRYLDDLRAVRATPLYERMRSARARLGPSEYRYRLANAGLTAARANDILSDKRRFLRASFDEQMALSTALLVDLNVDPIPIATGDAVDHVEPVLAHATGTLAEVAETERLSAHELLEVMELAEQKFGALAWSKAIHKRQTLQELIVDVRGKRG